MSGSTTAIQADVVVFGGGVAGLWLLNRLRQTGYRALLVETQALGMGQTRHSQGIIHGGTKYALTGVLNQSANAVAAMPQLWADCLAGRGPLDLSGVRVLSEGQYLWSTASLSSRMAGFFASKVMQSRTRSLDEAERPAIFTDPQFRGQVYCLNEPVLDAGSLVQNLAAPCRDRLLSADWPNGISIDPASLNVTLHSTAHGPLELSAQRLVFAAGQGNRGLLDAVGHAAPKMQLRPLHMVIARGELPTVYAHCLGASSVPRITISTHSDGQGKRVWYLGGQLAEEGVERSPGEQIAAARSELEALLPWVDLSRLDWSTLRIDRAEVKYDGKRPEDAFVDEREGIITGWPTKLALSPRLADAVIARLEDGEIPPAGEFSPEELDRLAAWPAPEYAPLPWEEESRWN